MISERQVLTSTWVECNGRYIQANIIVVKVTYQLLSSTVNAKGVYLYNNRQWTCYYNGDTDAWVTDGSTIAKFCYLR